MAIAEVTKKPGWRTHFLRYALLWMISVILSSLYLYDPHLLDPAPPAFVSNDEQISCPDPKNQVLCKLQEISDRLHPPNTSRQALFKAVIVGFLSWLWFATFKLRWQHGDATKTMPAILRGLPKRPWFPHAIYWCAIVASFIPAVIFALAMVAAYEPAVFAMALVAIYVAAVHHAGLEKTEDRIAQEVDTLEVQVGTLLNADGMDQWRARLYEEYRVAKFRIDAVVRYFDIDRAWWECKEGWSQYDERANEERALLLYVLRNSECEASVQFVADLPMHRPRAADDDNELLSARYFRDLMGLAWQLTVFAEVRNAREKRSIREARNPAYVRIKISGAPTWMHVVDDKTYQVVERPVRSQSCVRVVQAANPTDQTRLADWARRSIRQFAYRGCLGEEYLLSTLRYTALMERHWDDKKPLDQLNLETLLNGLGLAAYLANPDPNDFVLNAGNTESGDNRLFLNYDDARVKCVSTFGTFLEKIFPGPRAICIGDLGRRLL